MSTTLTFLGAASTVTGSKYLLTHHNRRILVDCGLFQGEKQWRLRNWDPFPVDPATITDVLLTHAHLDHSGYLPALVREGFAGRIHLTEGTRRLVDIVLRDSAHLQEADARYANEQGFSKHSPALPLYTSEDVERTLPLCTVVGFDNTVELGDGISFRMTRAGHILGSASIHIRLGSTAILFSGDLGRLDHPVLRAREIPPGAPYVVMESTYGNREHPDPTALPHEAFADAIRRTVARGGHVLVPAFAVDRTEVVLAALSDMIDDGRIPPVPIYVDSPMALAALDAYRDADHELAPGMTPSDFADLPNLRLARTVDESKALNNPRTSCIIISASGMATGGRVVHHLEHLLPDARNSVVITGYQAVGTRGRNLLEGAKHLKMHGQHVPVWAEIVHDGEFSVHADASDLMDWLRELSPAPGTVFTAHGEQDSATALAAAITAELGVRAVVPEYQEVVTLT